MSQQLIFAAEPQIRKVEVISNFRNVGHKLPPKPYPLSDVRLSMRRCHGPHEA